MSRDALVVGINTYDHLNPLKSPSEDAEAIAQRLENYGDFKVIRLPGVIVRLPRAIDGDHNTLQVGSRTRVTLEQLKKELEDLFLPEGRGIPDTALFYFSGHGRLRERKTGEERDQVTREGFLATSDVDSSQGNWGICLKWLRKLLKESPVKQQIIWLDCCYGGELLNFKENLKEADPRDSGRARDRCFIAASWNKAYQNPNGSYSVLTEALLRGLKPKRRQDHWVTNHTLVAFVDRFLDRRLPRAPQRLVSSHFGEPINLTHHRQVSPIEPIRRLLRGWFSSLYQFFRNPVQVPGWVIIFGPLLIFLVVPIASVLIWTSIRQPSEPITSSSPTPGTCNSPAAYVSGITFTPNGKYLAAASSNCTVQIYEASSTNPKLVADSQQHTDSIVAVKFSRTGKYLATASLDGHAGLGEIDGSGALINFKTLTCPSKGGTYIHPAVAIDFGLYENKEYLATGCADGTVQVWDTSTKEQIRNLEQDYSTYVTAVSFSQDGRYLAKASVNKPALVWEWEADSEGKKLISLPLKNTAEPQKDVVDVTFSPADKKYLATANADGTVQVWDITNLKKPVQPLNFKAYIATVSFSPDGKYIATTGEAKVWDWKTNKAVIEPPQLQRKKTVAIDFSADGTYLATATTDDPETKAPEGAVSVWDLSSGGEIESWQQDEQSFVVLAFKPPEDEKYLAIATSANHTRPTIRKWN